MKENPRSIHYDYSLFDNKNLSIVMIFHPITRKWKFYGWGCSKCQRILKSEQVAKNHINTCRFKTKFNTDDDTENIT